MIDYRRPGKLMSLVLCHEPQAIGLTLDTYGWADVAGLLAAMMRHGQRLTYDQLIELVQTDAKGRYAFSADGRKIRAVQGHSIPVMLGYPPCEPPVLLFHGTVARFIASIGARGLIAGARQHVHLSGDAATARTVGARRGRPVILAIEAGAMYRAGHVFHRADNGVWLTRAVSAEFLRHDKPAAARPARR